MSQAKGILSLTKESDLIQISLRTIVLDDWRVCHHLGISRREILTFPCGLHCLGPPRLAQPMRESNIGWGLKGTSSPQEHFSVRRPSTSSFQLFKECLTNLTPAPLQLPVSFLSAGAFPIQACMQAFYHRNKRKLARKSNPGISYTKKFLSKLNLPTSTNQLINISLKH